MGALHWLRKAIVGSSQKTTSPHVHPSPDFVAVALDDTKPTQARVIAIQRITDRAVLHDIARTNSHPELCKTAELAIAYLDILPRLDECAGDFSCVDSIIRGITDKALLARLSKEGVGGLSCFPPPVVLSKVMRLATDRLTALRNWDDAKLAVAAEARARALASPSPPPGPKKVAQLPHADAASQAAKGEVYFLLRDERTTRDSQPIKARVLRIFERDPPGTDRPWSGYHTAEFDLLEEITELHGRSAIERARGRVPKKGDRLQCVWYEIASYTGPKLERGFWAAYEMGNDPHAAP